MLQAVERVPDFFFPWFSMQFLQPFYCGQTLTLQAVERVRNFLFPWLSMQLLFPLVLMFLSLCLLVALAYSCDRKKNGCHV
jgi:hypothetical protein